MPLTEDEINHLLWVQEGITEYIPIYTLMSIAELFEQAPTALQNQVMPHLNMAPVYEFPEGGEYRINDAGGEENASEVAEVTEDLHTVIPVVLAYNQQVVNAQMQTLEQQFQINFGMLVEQIEEQDEVNMGEIDDVDLVLNELDQITMMMLEITKGG